MFCSQGPTTPQSLAASAFLVARAPDEHLQGAAVKFTEKGAIVIIRLACVVAQRGTREEGRRGGFMNHAHYYFSL